MGIRQDESQRASRFLSNTTDAVAWLPRPSRGLGEQRLFRVSLFHRCAAEQRSVAGSSPPHLLAREGGRRGRGASVRQAPPIRWLQKHRQEYDADACGLRFRADPAAAGGRWHGDPRGALGAAPGAAGDASRGCARRPRPAGGAAGLTPHPRHLWRRAGALAGGRAAGGDGGCARGAGASHWPAGGPGARGGRSRPPGGVRQLAGVRDRGSAGGARGRRAAGALAGARRPAAARFRFPAPGGATGGAPADGRAREARGAAQIRPEASAGNHPCPGPHHRRALGSRRCPDRPCAGAGGGLHQPRGRR